MNARGVYSCCIVLGSGSKQGGRFDLQGRQPDCEGAAPWRESQARQSGWRRSRLFSAWKSD